MYLYPRICMLVHKDGQINNCHWGLEYKDVTPTKCEVSKYSKSNKKYRGGGLNQRPSQAKRVLYDLKNGERGRGVQM